MLRQQAEGKSFYCTIFETDSVASALFHSKQILYRLLVMFVMFLLGRAISIIKSEQ